MPRGLAIAATLGLTTPHAAAQGTTYLARFEAALAAFDAADFAAAEAEFVRAGEHAPDAPVWRASAGVAAAHAGRVDTARAHFEAALRHGYPLSDLAALHPLAAEVARGGVAVSPDSWHAVSAAGLAAVPADSRVMRDELVVGEPYAPSTHLLGRFQHEAGQRLLTESRHTFYRLDWEAGTLLEQTNEIGWGSWTDSKKPSHGFNRGVNDPETALPRPRAAAFVRMLRTGLLLDDVAKSQASARLQLVDVGVGEGADLLYVHRPARWARSGRRSDMEGAAPNELVATLDLRRFEWGQPSLLPAASSDGLVRVDDDALTSRARAHLHPDLQSRAVVYRLTPGPDGRPGNLLVGVPAKGGSGLPERDGFRGVLRVLDPDATQVVCALGGEPVGVPDNDRQGTWHALPWHVPSAQRLITIDPTERNTLVAYDTESWSVPWTVARYQGAYRHCEVDVRGELVAVRWLDGETADLVDARDGSIRFHGERLGFSKLGVRPGGGRVVGQGDYELYVFDEDALRPDPDGGEPLVALWLHQGELVVAALDGTWSLRPGALDPLSRVLIGERLIGARDLAPWLLDPLHVRTLAQDQDRAPRRVPLL